MTTLRFTPVGDGLGLAFPPEVLERLSASEGAEIQLIDTSEGVFLSRVDTNTAEQIEAATEVMERRRDALRRLAQ